MPHTVHSYEAFSQVRLDKSEKQREQAESQQDALKVDNAALQQENKSKAAEASRQTDLTEQLNAAQSRVSELENSLQQLQEIRCLEFMHLIGWHTVFKEFDFKIQIELRPAVPEYLCSCYFLLVQLQSYLRAMRSLEVKRLQAHLLHLAHSAGQQMQLSPGGQAMKMNKQTTICRQEILRAHRTGLQEMRAQAR